MNEHVVLNALVYAEKTDEGQTLARNAFADGDVRVASMYRGDQLDDFLVSTTAGSAPLDVRGIDGQDVDAGATMAGFVLVFNASAKESGGQVVVGPGQVRLIYQDERTGRAGAAHPHAIVSDPEVNAGSKIWYPRKTPDLFIPSVGGENEAVMAFEFALPANAKPVDLIVKNLRLELSGWVPSDPEAVRTFTSSSDRDVAIVSGELFSGTGAGGSADLDRSKAVRVSGSDSLARSAQMGGNRVINSTTGIPGSLQVNADNAIVDGAAQIRNQDLTGNRGLDRALRIDRFATTPDTAILQIILSSGGERSPLGRIVESEGLNGRPFIIDEQGRTYDAVGYIYSDGRITYIKFEPGNPLGAMSEIEGQLSISTRDQTLILLFRPSQGVTITGFAVGDTLVGEMSEQMR